MKKTGAMAAMPNQKPTNAYSGYQMNIMAHPNARMTDLAKMRSKLASAKPAVLVEQQRTQRRRMQLTLGGLAYFFSGAAILVLAFLLSWAALAGKTSQVLQTKKTVQTLIPPGDARSIDDQTLYWTYALYDFQRLVDTYGVPANALVDGHQAAGELERLFPQASAKVKWEVMKYRNQLVRKLK